jgi:RNA polymerase sigma-B factor
VPQAAGHFVDPDERPTVPTAAVAPDIVSDEDLEGLTRAEQTTLLLRAAAQAGSPDVCRALQERAVEVNMPVAAQIAQRYRGRGVATEDLEQVAYLALVKAAQRYEYAEDRDFLSFAVPTIRGEVQRYFRDLGWTIRPTRTIQTAQSRIRQAEADLWQTLGRSPRPSEIAEHLDMELDTVVEALSANGCFSPSSLDAPLGDDRTPVSDTLGSQDEEFGRVDTRLALRPLLARLTDRERLMIEMRFFHQATQAQIGEALGITQMQVSRLLSALMARLQAELLEGDVRPSSDHSAA